MPRSGGIFYVFAIEKSGDLADRAAYNCVDATQVGGGLPQGDDGFAVPRGWLKSGLVVLLAVVVVSLVLA